MNFTNYTRNTYWKCDVPENTIKRITCAFEELDIHIEELIKYRVCQDIYWCQLHGPLLGLYSNGKGITPLSALASAYAEFTERFSYPRQWISSINMDEPLPKSDNFKNYEWIDGYTYSSQEALGDLYLSIEDLLAHQIVYNDTQSVSFIKQHERAKHWVDGYSLLEEATVKVPVKLIEWISGSNGLAAGNTMEEALIQAACELFERHCALKTVMNESSVPSFNTDTIDSRIVERMIDFYRSLNVELIVLDLSYENLFPCLGVLALDSNLPPNHMEHGLLFFGASFNSEEALARCLTEMMQGRGINPIRKSIEVRHLFNSNIYEKVENYKPLLGYGVAQKSLSFLREGPVRPFKKKRKEDIYNEMDEIKRICRVLDTDCIVVNMTHPELQFPVVRVIIPGITNVISAVTREHALMSRKILNSFYK